VAVIKLFPIGFVATCNSSSCGAWSSTGHPAINTMFEPNDGCSKQRSGYTGVSTMENRTMWVRKIGERKHSITYKYSNIWNSEYKYIKRFMDDIADSRANSFYVIDFSSGVKVTALASTGGNIRASIYNTSDFSATPAQGGYYTCLWNGHQRKFRIGINSAISEDSSITFPQSTDYGNLASILIADQVFAYPMYEVFLAEDNADLEVSGFVDSLAATSFAGPVRSGQIQFIQKDVK